MALEKLKIQVEESGASMSFGSNFVEALFNPSELSISKSVSWQSQEAAQRDVPELQFTNAQPRSLSLELFFDTYDSSETAKSDVRDHTDSLVDLTTVENHGDKHRPPVCRLSWGSGGVFFQGVLEKLDLKFTLFMEDGTPVRATASCAFKEWRTNEDDLRRQKTQSSDVAKVRIARRGDTLSGIAAEEYRDPGLWRPIADENKILDPHRLKPGQRLVIPTIRHRQRS